MQKNDVIYFDTIDSTNTYLKKHYKEVNHGVVVTSTVQTKGRGRSDHTWRSEKGNLYFSYLLKDKLSHQLIFQELMKVSVTICRVLKELGIKASIKYPNDILVNQKKIAGILIETKSDGELEYIITGVGLNVNQVDFNDLSHKATSLHIENEKTYLINNILKMIIDTYNTQPVTFDDYIKLSYVIGRKIRYNSKIMVVNGITEDGRLILEDDEIIYVSVNEITLEEIYE